MLIDKGNMNMLAMYIFPKLISSLPSLSPLLAFLSVLISLSHSYNLTLAVRFRAAIHIPFPSLQDAYAKDIQCLLLGNHRHRWRYAVSRS